MVKTIGEHQVAPEGQRHKLAVPVIFMTGHMLVGCGIASCFNASNGRLWLFGGLLSVGVGFLAVRRSLSIEKETELLNSERPLSEAKRIDEGGEA